MRVAVVGHVEWVEFLRVTRVPRAGEIVSAREAWGEAAGGGGVAVVELARLAGGSEFYTAVGGDEVGRRARAELSGLDVQVHATVLDEPHRRAFTYLDDDGERTITLLSRKLVPRGGDLLPWGRLREIDAVYFTGGDAVAVRHARAARVLVATARELATLQEAGVLVDALVRSADDEGERYEPGDIDPEPALVVATGGSDGGEWRAADGATGRYAPVPLPGPRVDAYGAGDSFAAGLTYALGEGRSTADALAFAARRGAEAMTRRGAHGTHRSPR